MTYVPERGDIVWLDFNHSVDTNKRADAQLLLFL